MNASVSLRIAIGLLAGLTLGGCSKREQDRTAPPESKPVEKRAEPRQGPEAACYQGRATSCRAAALQVLKRDRGEASRRRAAKLHAKACSGGLSVSCRELGVMAHGSLFKLEQRARYEKTACEGGDNGSCEWYGHRCYHGHGVPTSAEHAAIFFAKACDGAREASCSKLGDMYSEGEGVKKDPARAAALYEKGARLAEAACHRGPRACYSAGYYFHHGRGVKKDLRKAATLYRRACDAGTSNACDELKKLPARHRN